MLRNLVNRHSRKFPSDIHQSSSCICNLTSNQTNRLPNPISNRQSRYCHWYANGRPTVIGFPFAGGQSKFGVEETPRLIRELLPDIFENLDWKDVELSAEERISNAGMRRDHNNMKNFDATMRCNRKLFQTKIEIEGSKRVLVIGGDHSLSIGSIGASLAQHERLQVIWLSAHPDMTRPKDSKHGSMHEMAGAFLTGMEKDVACDFLPRTLPLDEVHHFGLRKFWEHEKDDFNKFKIYYSSVEHINMSQREAELKSLCSLIHPEAPTHVSFDVGVMDPSAFPSTGTPVPNGLQWEKTLRLLKFILENFNVVAMDIAEINLKLGGKPDQKISRAAISRLFDLIIK